MRHGFVAKESGLHLLLGRAGFRRGLVTRNEGNGSGNRSYHDGKRGAEGNLTYGRRAEGTASSLRSTR
jgi:hypothetical protein